MGDSGPQAPAVSAPQAPLAPQLQQPTQQVQHILQLNWSHFKPECSGKPEEDAETHLLRMSNWMNKHQFKGVKVQRFCLTLVGEERL